MLDVAVRFKEKDATVRYLPRKITLEQILKQYDGTPFEVAIYGPIVTIANTPQFTLRGWTKRDQSASEQDETLPQPIQLIVELVPAQGILLTSQPQISLSDPPTAELALAGEFQKVESGDKANTTRLVARLTETVTLKPGEIVVPVSFNAAGSDENQEATTGQLAVVLRTVAAKPAANVAMNTGVAMIGGTLELHLGHLCEQTGCVEHFHKSLADIGGLGAVRPRPSLEDPRATLYLRAQQPVDIWSLRERLRDRGVEIAGMIPQKLQNYRLRVELPRWKTDQSPSDTVQCMNCRERTVAIVEKLAWVKNVKVAGGGISFEPANKQVDLVELLSAITAGGTAPRAVWLVPAGASMPKTAAPQLTGPTAEPKAGGSQIHPLIEFDFAHTSEVGTNILSLLEKQKWASLTQFETASTNVARLAIADRKYANLTPLLHDLRATGRIPNQIRLREFGDIRIVFEFSHICGDIDYSKPPKPKPKPKKKKDVSKDKTKDAKTKPEETKPKPKKPFVPKALRPASTSNGRRAIEAAVAKVGWIKESVFNDYHTKPAFKGPRKLTIAFEATGDDVIQLEQLIDELQKAGFPPKSVLVSRRFAGIPFGKSLPGDLQLTDREGKHQLLGSLKKPNRPLVLAFISLNCPRNKKYAADPKYYQSLKMTIDKYQDRYDFYAISANKDDKFPDVVKFWEQTSVAFVPLFHDADGSARAAFNSQVTPAPHLFVFDAVGRLRYAGDAYDNFEAPDKPKEQFSDEALQLVLVGKYESNGAVYYNKSLCNCSHPKCTCPKCGCGSTCRCGVKRCGVGF